MGWKDPGSSYSSLVTHLDQNNYSLPTGKGSIHANSSIEFVTRVIKAEPWVLQVLREGVKLDLVEEPPVDYVENNNKLIGS